MSWWNIDIFRINIYHSLYTDITLIFRWSISLEGKVKGQIWHDVLKLLTVLFICWQYTPHVSTPSQSFIRICSNVIITDRKHVCQCSQKHNFLIRDKKLCCLFRLCFLYKVCPCATCARVTQFYWTSILSKYLHEWEKAVSVFANGVYRRKWHN